MTNVWPVARWQNFDHSEELREEMAKGKRKEGEGKGQKQSKCRKMRAEKNGAETNLFLQTSVVKRSVLAKLQQTVCPLT